MSINRFRVLKHNVKWYGYREAKRFKQKQTKRLKSAKTTLGNQEKSRWEDPDRFGRNR